MAGLPDPFDALTPEGKRVYDKIAAKRGAIRGPFAALMHHPALAASARHCPATSARWRS